MIDSLQLNLLIFIVAICANLLRVRMQQQLQQSKANSVAATTAAARAFPNNFHLQNSSTAQ